MTAGFVQMAVKFHYLLCTTWQVVSVCTEVQFPQMHLFKVINIENTVI